MDEETRKKLLKAELKINYLNFLKKKLQEKLRRQKLKELLDLIMRQFKLGVGSEHGLPHWKRVGEIGNYLAKHTKADPEVVYLFSYFHDSKRENEDHDPEHGRRASSFIKNLYNKKILSISQGQLNQLTFACEHHSDSRIKSDDLTIQICWDADRLDLWRIGDIPDPFFLNTAIAKKAETIDFAWKLSRK